MISTVFAQYIAIQYIQFYVKYSKVNSIISLTDIAKQGKVIIIIVKTMY